MLLQMGRMRAGWAMAVWTAGVAACTDPEVDLCDDDGWVWRHGQPADLLVSPGGELASVSVSVESTSHVLSVRHLDPETGMAAATIVQELAEGQPEYVWPIGMLDSGQVAVSQILPGDEGEWEARVVVIDPAAGAAVTLADASVPSSSSDFATDGKYIFSSIQGEPNHWASFDAPDQARAWSISANDLGLDRPKVYWDASVGEDAVFLRARVFDGADHTAVHDEIFRLDKVDGHVTAHREFRPDFVIDELVTRGGRTFVVGLTRRDPDAKGRVFAARLDDDLATKWKRNVGGEHSIGDLSALSSVATPTGSAMCFVRGLYKPFHTRHRTHNKVVCLAASDGEVLLEYAPPVDKVVWPLHLYEDGSMLVSGCPGTGLGRKRAL